MPPSDASVVNAGAALADELDEAAQRRKKREKKSRAEWEEKTRSEWEEDRKDWDEEPR